MTEVVSVRFKSRGKSYYFDPGGHKVATGQNVIVETSKGLEFGECARGNFDVEDDKVIPPLRPVVRLATPKDIAAAEANKEKERRAFTTCLEKIREHKLDMKLVDVEYNFEGNKILFFFTSDGRVDFRELVKDLAGIFRTRIELRQIGVRDEAKMLGGLGICGKPFCCSQFLDEFQPVSIKMAKTQNLSLNPTKISGTCGRLMCCLKYEQEAYEQLVKNAPKVDSCVETPEGNGTITEINLLRQRAKVRMDSRGGDPVINYFPLEEVQFIKTGKQHRAEMATLAKQREAGGDAPQSAPGGRRLQMGLDGERGNQRPAGSGGDQHPKRDGQKSGGQSGGHGGGHGGHGGQGGGQGQKARDNAKRDGQSRGGRPQGGGQPRPQGQNAQGGQPRPEGGQPQGEGVKKPRKRRRRKPGGGKPPGQSGGQGGGQSGQGGGQPKPDSQA